MDIQISTIKETAKKGGAKLVSLGQTGLEKFKGFSKKKKIVTVSVVAILLIAFISLLLSPGQNQALAYTTVPVERGDISVIISGTGTIKPIDEYEVTSLVKGEILSDTFAEGDMVEKGDLLYVIDSSDLENNLERARLNLQKSQASYNQTMEELSNLNVKAKYNGTLTETYVRVGDSVSKGTKIADLLDKNTMTLSLPFLESDAKTISVGNSAEVMVTNSLSPVSGVVTRVSTGSLISAEGVQVRMVDIELHNPGGLQKGDTATVLIGDAACNSPGTLEYKVETTITAETSGEVVSMPCGKGDVVSKGTIVAVLESSSSTSTRLNSQASLRDSQLSIENYNEQLEDYRIEAPISGTVLKKTSKAGDTLDNSNAQVVMAVIADMSTIVFEMSVDELDISKIKVGQDVVVTADAIEDKIYSGYVDYVSVVGSTQNGVTTYPITVVVENPEGLIPGMNVSAEIEVESSENVLRVPVTAVNRGNIVYVKGKAPKETQEDKTQGERPDGELPESNMTTGERPEGEMPAREKFTEERPQQDGGSVGSGTVSQAKAPDGFYAVRVVTGLNDSDYIEIVSGLSEGDEVYVPVSVGSSNNTVMGMMAMGGGMPGSMGGSIPGGMSGSMGSGMPGGK